MTGNDRGRPPAKGAAPTSIATDETIVPPAADLFRDSYAVLVRGLTVRRHLYFNLPAAERAVKRAQLRGDSAELVLVRLVPVDSRHLDQAFGHETR